MDTIRERRELTGKVTSYSQPVLSQQIFIPCCLPKYWSLWGPVLGAVWSVGTRDYKLYSQRFHSPLEKINENKIIHGKLIWENLGVKREHMRKAFWDKQEMRSVFLAVQNISVKRDVFHLEPTCNSSLLLGQALRDFFKAHIKFVKLVTEITCPTIKWRYSRDGHQGLKLASCHPWSLLQLPLR